MFRLRSINIQGIKNVSNGSIVMPCADSRKACIVGIYGQNGSGKTALVQALGILQSIMNATTDEDSRQRAVELIEIGSERAIIKASFIHEDDDGDQFLNGVVDYQLTLRRRGDSCYIESEFLDFKEKGKKKVALLHHSIELDDSDILSSNFVNTPLTHWRRIGAVGQGFGMKFDRLQWSSYEDFKTLIFSLEMYDLCRAQMQHFDQLMAEGKLSNQDRSAYEVLLRTAFFLVDLHNYASNRFTIIGTMNNAFITMNRLPLYASSADRRYVHSSAILVDLRKPNLLSRQRLDDLNHVIDTVNLVLNTLIPGLTLELKELEHVSGDDGTIEIRTELVSNRDGRRTILRNESEGILKIISIIGNIIMIFNDPGSLLVIDELDTGVFEFLLGELLEVISESGKGQLIFTAHNLRPLEMLPPKSIYFTTTNPENRYIMFNGVKSSNNLRNLYIRALSLGGQAEEIYAPTNRFDIAHALRKAGIEREAIEA